MVAWTGGGAGESVGSRAVGRVWKPGQVIGSVHEESNGQRGCLILVRTSENVLGAKRPGCRLPVMATVRIVT